MSGRDSIVSAAAALRSGELTSVELVQGCLNRIACDDATLGAFLTVFGESALAAAQVADHELAQGCDRGPLHGIPVGVKDIIDVFDLPTGCGSKLWANSVARRDATCVARLRQAGAVILGKTVTTAFAFLDPPVTRNPWNLDRTPGGSSSGSAAAVACGMCLAALGTQTGGSVTRPASYCGVCSLKPTWGRISVDGVLPFAPSLDHVGVMANCVRDLAIVLQPLARTDADEVPSPYRYLTQIDREPSRPWYRQLAALPDFLPERASPEMAGTFAAWQQRTRAAGWAWESLPLPPSFATAPDHHQAVMAVEAAAYHGDRLRRHPDDYPPRIRSLIEAGLSVPVTDYHHTTTHYRAFRDEIDRAFVDSWETFATPATTGPAPAPDTTGDPALNAPWSYSGLPTVSLPIGWSADGLPLAVQLTGRRWCEDDLLGVAARLEPDTGFVGRPLPLD
jgi:Asp-tRNA(Asn)/Glu-tRNA(Gln) amidotransferase A subunit family amidase